jgi:adenylate cyclase
MRLDPHYEPLASLFLGHAHYMLKQYSQAVRFLRDYTSRVPNLHGAHVWLAATYAQLGQFEEAQAEAAKVRRLHPTWSISGARRVIAFKYAKDDKHFFEGVRKAGLPE